MSSLSVGIVGLPNAGKSTLFNALVSRRLAETAPRPFTTINPHEAVVALPDGNLQTLSSIIKPQETIPAHVTFIDIAGLVKGAHKGEGLGNQFLAKIREVDALCHVVRAFYDPLVSHENTRFVMGSLRQIYDDIETVKIELELGEIGGRPSVVVLNISEDDINSIDTDEKIIAVSEKFKTDTIATSAKIEEDLIDFTQEEKESYFKQADIKNSGLENLIIKAYELLDLITFYTVKGGKEVRAWSFKRGKSAIDAAGKVHTDFADKFIKAEVVGVKDLIKAGGWKEAKEKGKIRLEGKDYIVRDRDVIEFKVGG